MTNTSSTTLSSSKIHFSPTCLHDKDSRPLSSICIKNIPLPLDHLNQVDHLLPCCSSSVQITGDNNQHYSIYKQTHTYIHSLLGTVFSMLFTSENLSKLDKSSSESSSQSFQLMKSTLSQLF